MAKPVNWFAVVAVLAGMVAAVVIATRVPRLPQPILSFLNFLDLAVVKLGLLVVLSKLILSGIMIACGIWEGWKWRSGWDMLFWLAYAPVFIGFLFTALTGHLIWYLAVLGGLSFLAVLKVARRIRFARP